MEVSDEMDGGMDGYRQNLCTARESVRQGSSGKAQSGFRDRAACLTVLGAAHRYVLGSSHR